MKITIDTEIDSKETIKKTIELLGHLSDNTQKTNNTDNLSDAKKDVLEDKNSFNDFLGFGLNTSQETKETEGIKEINFAKEKNEEINSPSMINDFNKIDSINYQSSSSNSNINNNSNNFLSSMPAPLPKKVEKPVGMQASIVGFSSMFGDAPEQKKEEPSMAKANEENNETDDELKDQNISLERPKGTAPDFTSFLNLVNRRHDAEEKKANEPKIEFF
jgi:hypothetical protein